MISLKTNYTKTLLTPSDYAKAECIINNMLYKEGLRNLLDKESSLDNERFSPEWHELFNRKANIACGIAYKNLLKFKGLNTFKKITEFEKLADKLEKIRCCVGKTSKFFLKCMDLIHSRKESTRNGNCEEVESKKVTIHSNDKVHSINARNQTPQRELTWCGQCSEAHKIPMPSCTPLSPFLSLSPLSLSPLDSESQSLSPLSLSPSQFSFSSLLESQSLSPLSFSPSQFSFSSLSNSHTLSAEDKLF